MAKRPFSVNLLIASVVLLALYNLVRLLTALEQWRFLKRRTPPFVAPYIALTGLFWTVVFSAMAINLLFALKWARFSTAAGIVVYLLYYWADRLLFSAQPRSNTLFMLVFAGLYFFFTILILNLPAGQKFFRRRK